MSRQRKSVHRTILIVDDHQLIRQSMAQVLRQTFDDTVVIEAETLRETLERLADPTVFLAIVDLSIPGMDSPRDLEKLRRLRPDVRLVVLSGSEARADILAALVAGVHGYIVKRDRTENVVAHLKHVLAGEIYVPPVLAELPVETAPPLPSVTVRPGPKDALTSRQREVLALIVEGQSNKEIGLRLAVAEGTVKMHVATILRAIDAKNRAHAAAIGKQFLDGTASR